MSCAGCVGLAPSRLLSRRPATSRRRSAVSLVAAVVAVAVAGLAFGGCDGDGGGPLPGDGSALPLERYVPGAASPLRLGSVLAVRGDAIVAGPFTSLDGGATWSFLPTFPITRWEWASDTAGLYPSAGGATWLDLATGQRVNHTFAEGSPWLVLGEDIVVLELVQVSGAEAGGPGVRPRLRMVAVDGVGASWRTLDLPILPEASRTYLPSLHHGEGGTLYVVGTYGMLHGAPVEDEEWTYYPLVPEPSSIGWSDNQVWVSRSGTIHVSTLVSFDGGETFANRTPSGAPWEHQDDDGTLHIGGLRSTDGGQTWVDSIEQGARERLDEFIGAGNDRLRGRGDTVYVTRSEYLNLVVTSDGRIETFVPHVPLSRDSRARNARDIVVLEDGRLLGHADGELLRITPGDAAWTWLGTVPPGAVLTGLPDGRVVMTTTTGTTGSIRISDDGGDTWSEPRSAPLMHRIFTYGGTWVGVNRASCRISYTTTDDEFVTWEQYGELTPVFEPSGEPVDLPYEFEAVAQATGGELHGSAVGFAIDLNGSCSVNMGYPARSTDRARTAIRASQQPRPYTRPLAINARDGLIGTRDSNDGDLFELQRGASGSWIMLGAPEVDGVRVDMDSQTFIASPQVRFDRGDHLLVPTAEGLVRTARPLR